MTAGNAAKRVLDTSPGPWKTDPAWKKIKARHLRAIKFIETYCAPPKGAGHGSPLKLAPFQKAFLKAVLADGVDSCVLTTPRGNGKSSFSAALAVWALFDDDETGAPQIPIVATTVGQAIKSVYSVAASMIRKSPELANRSIPYTAIGDTKTLVPYNEGVLFPVANDTDTLQGLDPSMGIFDEIGFQPITSWDSLRLAGGKRSRSLIVGVGTRGLDTENALHELLQIVHEGKRIPGFVLHEYVAPDDAALDDRKAWKVANPALGKFLRQSALETDLLLAQANAGGGEGRFRIFRMNQFWQGVDSWLGMDGRKLWDALQSPYEFKDREPTWVGIDVGIHRDSTAVVWIQRRPDGKFHAKCKIWIPQQNEAIQLADVRAFIRDLSLKYSVQAVSYDPRFFEDSAQMLHAEKVKMMEIPQTLERMTPACGGLLTAIKNAELHHDGQPEFTTQVLNAVPYPNERGFTLKKSKSRGRIDACIALALAWDRAAMQKPPRAPLFAGSA